MTASLKVTVVIPVYNREKYVGEAFKSILAQTFPDFELLVIDDGSTDRSREVVRSYHDPRMRLASQQCFLFVMTSGRISGIQSPYDRRVGEAGGLSP